MVKIKIVFLTLFLSGCISLGSSYESYVFHMNHDYLGKKLSETPTGQKTKGEKEAAFIGIKNLENGNHVIGYFIARKTCPTWFEYDPATEIIVRWWTTAKNPRKDCGINA